MTTPKLGLTEMVSAQSQPEIPVNQALRALDQIEQLAVLAIQNTPAVSPADGDAYIVDTAPTGAWSGHAHAIAYWVAGTFLEWRFKAPNSGWLAYVVALDKYYYFKASTPAWIVTAVI